MRKRYPSLRAYLTATKTTQEQLGRALGLPQARISGYVTGRVMPRPELALRIAAYTGVPVEALVRARAAREVA